MEKVSALEKVWKSGSDSLYLFFGGIQAGIAMPPFEFYQASGIINENKLFLRDFAQSWYHDGLKGVSKSVDETADYIQELVDEVNPRKLFFVGNSMGGYAAILFSTLLGRGEAIAFAPQTFISSNLRKKHNDTRWPEQIANTVHLETAKKDAFDLKQLLLNSNSKNKISVYVAKDSPLDMVHAEHIHGCPGVTIFQFASGGHTLVRELRDSNKLPQIMAGKYAKTAHDEQICI